MSRTTLTRELVRWHRWTGITAAVFVLILAITGILLQHAPTLGLDTRSVGSPFLARLVGLQAADPVGITAQGHQLVGVGEQLFWDGQQIAETPGSLRGAVATNLGVATLQGKAVMLIGSDGRVLETLTPGAGLPGPTDRLGKTPGGEVVIRTTNGITYRPDSDWLGYQRDEGAAADWSDPDPITNKTAAALRDQVVAAKLKWEHLLLELHSGRLAGPIGKFIMDAAAIALLALAATGIWLWSRRR